MKHAGIIYAALILFLPFSACKKDDPGEGGTSSIKGVLIAKNAYDPSAPVSNEDFESDRDVYIAYGDNNTYDDKMDTGADGSFQFKYLRPGTYRVFAYSKDPITKNTTTVSKTVTIKNNQNAEVKDFVIYCDPDDMGTSTIKGKVKVKKFSPDWTYISEYPGAEEDVYITCGDNNFIFDNQETNYDGTFEFVGLRKGKYKVFAYGDDQNSQSQEKEFLVEVTIAKRNEVVISPDIYINKAGQ